MKILIFGISTSGKTTLALALIKILGISYFNADEIRSLNNDWDFSIEGRYRQLQRMLNYSNSVQDSICDFVCPLQQFRDIFKPDFSIWVNTKEYTLDNLFEASTTHDLLITDYTYDVNEIVKLIYAKCGPIQGIK